MTVERREGPTPAGGAYSEAIRLDDGLLVEIVEYDESGVPVARTYASGLTIDLRDPRGWGRHSERLRKVSTRYPLRVTQAYAGDVSRAMGDSDEQVAATVAAWESQQGLEIRDWAAIGAEERDEVEEGSDEVERLP